MTSSETPVLAWWVYLLRCGDGSLYCGVTTDLVRRTAQHSAGTGARYSRGRGPLTLVYAETQPGYGLALRREAAIKRLSRSQKEDLIRLGRLPAEVSRSGEAVASEPADRVAS